MRRLPFFVLAVALVAGCSKHDPVSTTRQHAQPPGLESQQQAEPPGPETEQPTRTPEEVVRAFFIAMFSNDEVGVRKEILPDPDSAILWQGRPVPPGLLRQLTPHLQNMTCRECVVGEIVDLPGAPSLEVTDQVVNERRKLLFPIIGDEPSPVPLLVILVDGVWKVDAAPLIAARQTARRMMEKEALDQ